MLHEFSRTELLIGKENLDKLRKSTILVFGVGGVGSHCIEALARSGVGKLILVDNDVVSITNINRQSIAYNNTVGQLKTKLMEARIHDISPQTVVETKEIFVLPENVDQVITDEVDYVIDAIDTVTAKIAIVVRCKELGVPLLASMGTGNKIHPELFTIADLSKTSMCPLCKVMRKELKARGIYKLKVLYSKEKPIDTTGNKISEKSSKRALPGSISFTPPVAGLLIAAEVVRDLTGIK